MITMPALLEGLLAEGVNLAHLTVHKITTHANKVDLGDIFVALQEETFNDESSIPQAIRNGARIVITSKHYQKSDYPGVVFIKVDNPHKALSLLSKRFFPKQPDISVVVTGTHGKSSVVHFLRHLWAALGYTCASIGTLGTFIHKNGKEQTAPPYDSSPLPLEFHEALNRLSNDGVTHCAFEATAKGMERYRNTSADVSAAAFTSFSEDHLDHYITMEAYFEAKTVLFRHILPAGRPAVLNADIPEFEKLNKICLKEGCPVLSYGKKGDLHLKSHAPTARGQHITLEYENKSYEIDLPFVGLFHAENVLCALGLALSCGAPMDLLIQALPTLTPVPGRLELVGTTINGARVYVDEAHKAESLENILKTLRSCTQGKVHLVFDFEGDIKEILPSPSMCDVAQKWADAIYVTQNKINGGDMQHTRQQILALAPNVQYIGDRCECVLHAFKKLQVEDILLLVGRPYRRSNPEKIKISSSCDARFIIKELLTTLAA